MITTLQQYYNNFQQRCSTITGILQYVNNVATRLQHYYKIITTALQQYHNYITP